MIAPSCPTCAAAARLTTGAEVLPHQPETHGKHYWRCDGCGAYVGCHAGTTAALGTPAGPGLRKARLRLHRQMDALWRAAADEPCYAKKTDRQKSEKAVEVRRNALTKVARGRVYDFLAERLSLTSAECHVGLFDLGTCSLAHAALHGLTYADIREWAHQRRRRAA